MAVNPLSQSRVARMFVAGMFAFCLLGCSKTEFQQQHDRDVSKNPGGVELTFRTLDGKTKFRVSEEVQFEEFYTSKYPAAWQMEVLEAWNEATVAETAYITDGNSSWRVDAAWGSITCCRSRRVWLDSEPTRVPYRLRGNGTYEGNPKYKILPLPNKPGKYQVYLTSHRVFGGQENEETYLDKGLPVTSRNILTLELVEDGAEPH